ncbi:MAG: malonyl-ACP O-methyltransferase BioC [Candidatus Gastranaerophilales bacterium]|nr:malonyl-ACP O-methyltransferase BioC [Candidatus Gastranaerophilales bacterium]
MIKELIKKRFGRSLDTYDKSAIVQKHMSEKLAGMSDLFEFENILELGCGTGFVTKILDKKVKYSCYDAVDIVSGCHDYIKSISKEINFINMDIENFIPEKKYNLIISNAAFQWLNDFSGFINKLKNYIESDGLIMFTTFGERNFCQLSKLLKNNLKYYSIDGLKSILSGYDIKVLEEEIIELNFQSPSDVLYHIKNTGVNALSDERWTRADLRNFEAEYKKMSPEGIKLTYNPIYIVLKII